MTNPARPVFVALGSNLGDSAANIHAALERLQQLSGSAVKCSSLWKSPPVDCPPGSPDFINAAVRLTPRAGDSPEKLLVNLQGLEREMGRRPKTILNEARLIDLDLIAWGAEMRSGPSLILPHPRAHLRRFVLAPMSEIAPDFVLPGQTCTIEELLKALKMGGPIVRM